MCRDTIQTHIYEFKQEVKPCSASTAPHSETKQEKLNQSVSSITMSSEIKCYLTYVALFSAVTDERMIHNYQFYSKEDKKKVIKVLSHD